nr:hypothetical protein [uncultured Carboxylicivirga sp.]
MEEMIVLNSTQLKKMISDGVKSAFQDVLKEVDLDNSSEEIMLEKDVCSWIKKSRQTVIAWSERGILKRHVVSGSVFYLRSEVLKAITNSEKA